MVAISGPGAHWHSRLRCGRPNNLRAPRLPSSDTSEARGDSAGGEAPAPRKPRSHDDGEEVPDPVGPLVPQPKLRVNGAARGRLHLSCAPARARAAAAGHAAAHQRRARGRAAAGALRLAAAQCERAAAARSAAWDLLRSRTLRMSMMFMETLLSSPQTSRALSGSLGEAGGRRRRGFAVKAAARTGAAANCNPGRVAQQAGVQGTGPTRPRRHARQSANRCAGPPRAGVSATPSDGASWSTAPGLAPGLAPDAAPKVLLHMPWR